MRTFVSTLFALALTGACSDAPRSVPAPSAQAPRALPSGHPEIPANHPPVGPAPTPHTSPSQLTVDESIVFTGSIRLVGPLQDVKSGFVFVSVRAAAGGGPRLSYRIDLADPELREPVLVTDSNGTRTLNFILNQRTSQMPGTVERDIALELQLLYDPDGDIDTKDGRYATVVPTVIGREHELELPAKP